MLGTSKYKIKYMLSQKIMHHCPLVNLFFSDKCLSQNVSHKMGAYSATIVHGLFLYFVG